MQGLIPRASKLAQLGVSFWLGLWPIVLGLSVVTAVTYGVRPSCCLHTLPGLDLNSVWHCKRAHSCASHLNFSWLDQRIYSPAADLHTLAGDVQHPWCVHMVAVT